MTLVIDNTRGERRIGRTALWAVFYRQGDNLVNAANRAGGTDNITVVVARF
jgi:serine/threonine protein phosphatase PrpC